MNSRLQAHPDSVPHLSHDQITRCLVPDADMAERKHIEQCAACAGELASLETSLLQFQGAMTQLSEMVGECHPEYAWKQRLGKESRRRAERRSYPTSVVATASIAITGSIANAESIHPTGRMADSKPEDRFIAAESWQETRHTSSRRNLGGFFHDLREWISPKQVVQLGLASVAVPVREIKIYASGGAKAGVCSVAIHAGLIGLVMLIAALQPAGLTAINEVRTRIVTDLRPYLSRPARDAGGGGGSKSPLDASQSKLPKPSPRQFTPPRIDAMEARLQIPASIIAPDDLPDVVLTEIGDIQSRLGVLSNGSGLRGIGRGDGGGDGDGHGPGGGPGSKGGFGPGVYRIGGAVSAPQAIKRVEPEYSEEARKARWQGTVLLSVVIDDQGRVQAVKVVRSLGLGLDQNAIDAVKQWRFKPGRKDGKPVPVSAQLEVTFRLL